MLYFFLLFSQTGNKAFKDTYLFGLRVIPGISLLWQTVDIVSNEILKEDWMNYGLDEQTVRWIEKGVNSQEQRVEVNSAQWEACI